MKKQGINKLWEGHRCHECKNFTPYTAGNLDVNNNPVLGACPHATGLILRSQRACSLFE